MMSCRTLSVTDGPEVLSFLDASVPAEAHAQIRDAAIDILAKGAPPTDEIGQETGLVVGYVQSGKTMSFETVAAVARDNGFQIVIVGWPDLPHHL